MGSRPWSSSSCAQKWMEGSLSSRVTWRVGSSYPNEQLRHHQQCFRTSNSPHFHRVIVFTFSLLYLHHTWGLKILISWVRLHLDVDPSLTRQLLSSTDETRHNTLSWCAWRYEKPIDISMQILFWGSCINAGWTGYVTHTYTHTNAHIQAHTHRICNISFYNNPILVRKVTGNIKGFFHESSSIFLKRNTVVLI